MTARRTALLSALTLTAALFFCLPGLWRALMPPDDNRMHESLRPPRTRVLAVWQTGSETADGTLLKKICAAFEKANPGVRIFLRTADAQEYASPDAVLPDVALYETGSLNIPDKVFVPLADETAVSGQFAGVSYGIPLWLSPNVLSMPAEWFAAAAVSPDALPWKRLLEESALSAPEGVALQQLLSMCPYPLRSQLPSAVGDAQEKPAQVRTLARHLKDVQTGKTLAACVMTPAVCDRVRYASICKDSPDARAFVQFLKGGMAQAVLDAGLIPLHGQGEAADELTRQAQMLFGGIYTLPNAFAHSRQELLSLCRQGFDRLDDPVGTLLRLR